jgi:hypothetical protein
VNDDLRDKVERFQRERNNGRTVKEVMSDQYHLVLQWLEENLDYILAKTTATDKDLITLNPASYERGMANSKNVPPTFQEDASITYKRLNALNFLMWTVNKLKSPAQYAASIKEMKRIATKGLDRQFDFSRCDSPSKKLRDRVARDWLTIAEAECELRKLLCECEFAESGNYPELR